MRGIEFRGYQIQQSGKYALAVVHVLHGGKWKTRQLLGYDPDAQTKWVQYTGLKDKNGKEIYEGDIVECVEKEMFNKRKNHIKFASPVFWDECSWTLRESEHCETSLTVYDNSNPTKLPVTTIKVIGNIYENSELLKEAE